MKILNPSAAAQETVRASELPPEKTLVDMFYYMHLTRELEFRIERKLYRQGKIVGGVYVGRGQEAIAVGACIDLRQTDVVCPSHRDMGAFLIRGMPLRVILGQYMARKTGATRGRDGNMHMGDMKYNLVAFVSMLGDNVPVAAGIGMSFKMRKEDRVVVCFFGDGATSRGDWHEGINLAAVMKVPVVYVCNNNQYAYSTPLERQMAVENVADRAEAYGLPGVIVDGNDVVEVWTAVSSAIERARSGQGPTLVECKTFRMTGHSAHDDAGYVPPELFRYWEERDPIRRHEQLLLERGIINPADVKNLRARVNLEIDEAIQLAEKDPFPEPEDCLRDVYYEGQERVALTTYVEAIKQGIWEEMEKDERVFILGEDVGIYGGAFKVTAGMLEKFGEQRVVDTPISESAIVGAAIGAALMGMRPIAEMQFADFISCAFDQITNFAAKCRYRWGAGVPIVVRGPSGGGVHGGPFHSQNPEMYFVHTPGLKVVCPATAYDAKGLIKAAIRDPDPVIYFEHKFLYRRIKEQLPSEDYTVPIGKAAIRRQGADISVITYGAMVYTALDAAKELEKEGIDLEVLDLRSLLPFDKEAVLESVKKTNKVILLHEDTEIGGFAGELAAIIADQAFEYLDGPIRRITAPNTPVPYSPPLEEFFLPKVSDVIRVARELYAY